LWRILKTFKENSQTDAQARIATRRRGRGLRTFTLLPITSFQRRFILIDSTALSHLFHGELGFTLTGFQTNIEARWKDVFQVDKVTTTNRRFGFSVSTDGMSVSVNIRRIATEWNGVNSHGFTEDGSYVPLDIEGARVVGLDPGRRDLFRTAHGEEKGEGKSCSLKEWRSIAGITRATKKRETWLKNNANIKQIVRGRSSLYLYICFYSLFLTKFT
jgi:hypothetical protein